MVRLPRLPKSMFRPPPGFKKPKVEDFRSDMQRVGEEIAEQFKEQVIENIETNYYGFELAQSTIERKGSDVPWINSHELVDSIYREGTVVSVEDTPREDSKLTNLQLAIVQEYGTKDRHIPPVRMEFRYDVSIVSKSYNEFLAMQDYFNSTFVSQTGFLFNKKVVDGDEVGDVVLYTVRPTDIPRTDGVYEMNYEFTLKPWIYAVKPKEVELVQAIILRSKMFEEEIIINPGEGFPYTLPLNLE
jgi:hypothetical protein